MRVCICSRYSYALFDPTSATTFGGAEVRATRFAKGLAERPGFEVTCVVGNEDQHPRQRFGKVLVVAEEKPYQPPPEPLRHRGRRRRKRGFFDHTYLLFCHSAERIERFPYMRVVHWHPGLLWQVPVLSLHFAGKLAMAPARWLRAAGPIPPLRRSNLLRDIDCDVVCGFGINNLTAQLVVESRKRGVPCVLFLASEQDISPEYKPHSKHVGPHGDYAQWCYYAIRHADHLIVQTEHQQHVLAQKFGRQATLIRNPLPRPNVERDPLPADDRFALWIGRAERAYKRPEVCLELARRCPDVPFLMVLNPSVPGLYEELAAQAPANVRIVPKVPFDQIDAYFRHAAMLVNTSRLEGFPNTFLQAANHGVPIVSMNVDPDGFISRNGCGIVAGEDPDKLAAGVQTLWRSPEQARALGAAGQAHVDAAHGLEGRIDELIALLETIRMPKRLRFDKATQVSVPGRPTAAVVKARRFAA